VVIHSLYFCFNIEHQHQLQLITLFHLVDVQFVFYTNPFKQVNGYYPIPGGQRPKKFSVT
jgi:hypothetical protein